MFTVGEGRGVRVTERKQESMDGHITETIFSISFV